MLSGGEINRWIADIAEHGDGTPLILVAALGNDGLIGQGSGLPWNIPEEYEHFLDLIKGHTMLIGRKSYDIFGPDLSSSKNLVLSRSITKAPRAKVYSSLKGALSAGRRLPMNMYCGGGASVYNQTISIADWMLLSFVRGDYEGEVYFPKYIEAQWREELREQYKNFDFVALRKI